LGKNSISGKGNTRREPDKSKKGKEVALVRTLLSNFSPISRMSKRGWRKGEGIWEVRDEWGGGKGPSVWCPDRALERFDFFWKKKGCHGKKSI